MTSLVFLRSTCLFLGILVSSSQATSIAARALPSPREILSCGDFVVAGWSPKELTNILIDALWLPNFPNEETPSNVLTDFSAGRLMQSAAIWKVADIIFNVGDQASLNAARSEINAAFYKKSSCIQGVKDFLVSD